MFFIDRKLKVDDPVGAIAVHGVNGITRRACRSASSPTASTAHGWNLTTTFTDADGDPMGVTGVLYSSDGWGQLASQAVGARDLSS